MAIRKFGKLLAIWAVLAAAFLVISAAAESKARIVRLSEVQGTVQIARAPGDGFGRAFINLPVIEGSRVRTGKDGRAEVEFEDGSALRLAPNSQVDFTHLALSDAGERMDTLQLVLGTVYADLHPKKASSKEKDQFLLNFSTESVTLAGPAHFRLEFTSTGKATVAVFKGKLSATGPSGQFEVAEKHAATITFVNDEAAGKEVTNNGKKDTFVIAKNYEAEPSDAWDRQQTDYHDRYASVSNSSLTSPYAYGVSDLNYYGNFMNLPGYGNVWQPYLIGANWSPFQDGAWALYPGAGYMWVSGYPWGWMPYNYGNWALAPGFGWVWQPGNNWGSWNALPLVVNAPARMTLPTVPTNARPTVMVGRGLAAYPAGDAPLQLTINPGSAGFGVPRGSVDHLDRVAKTVNRTSHPVVVSTASQPAPASAPAELGARGMSSPGTATAAGSAHRAGAAHP